MQEYEYAIREVQLLKILDNVHVVQLHEVGARRDGGVGKCVEGVALSTHYSHLLCAGIPEQEWATIPSV